jgi:hypothetical protein
MESSSNGSSEDVAHTVDDTVKQIESTTGALKLELMKNLSASFETIKRREVLGVPCIVDKITLTPTSLNDRKVYKVLELRSALIPVRWNEHKKWVNFLELMVTVQVVLLKQSRVSDDLEGEMAGLTAVLLGVTVSSKLTVSIKYVDI